VKKEVRNGTKAWPRPVFPIGKGVDISADRAASMGEGGRGIGGGTGRESIRVRIRALIATGGGREEGMKKVQAASRIT
jgi:hypothetical protein